MNEEVQEIDIMENMLRFLQGIMAQYFEGREDVAIYQKKKKLTLYAPNENGSDATLVRCTKVDDSTVSFVVYQESKPEAKLFMGYYNKSCNDPERNIAKLTKLAIDISIPLAGKQEPEPIVQVTNPSHSVKIEDIVRVTSVDTVDVMEHHVLAVGFDGQPPLKLSVPKDQLGAFIVGNKMMKLPFGFQLLENNPVIH